MVVARHTRISSKPRTKLSGKSLMKQQAPDEDILQRQIVAKFRAHNAIVIMTDAVGPALKFISDPKKRMGFVSWSKARGWTKGIPDVCVVWKGSILFLELKSPTGKGRLSDDQKIWRDKITEAGYEYACWNTLEECDCWIAEKLKSSNQESNPNL